VPKTPRFNLQGILSLLTKKPIEWLTNLISKTRGADGVVESITKPYDPQNVLMDIFEKTARGEFGITADEIGSKVDLETLARLRLKDAISAGFSVEDWIKARTDPGALQHTHKWTEGEPAVTIEDWQHMDWDQAQKFPNMTYEKWQQAQDLAGYTWDPKENAYVKVEENWELVPEHLRPAEFQENPKGYDKAVKEQIEKEKKKGIFTLIQGGKDDDWSPPGLAGGGIKIRTPKLHDTGLMKSLLKLGTTMGMSEKELLEMAIKFNWDVSDKLKKQYGITDEGLRAGSDKGLEWLLLKANPDLAKQPYSESKVNKMLSEEIGELPSKQMDLFKKKTGGLVSLVNG